MSLDKAGIKINFGSSFIAAPGWINLDNSRRHILVSRIPGLPRLLHAAGLITTSMYEAHKRGNWRLVRYGDARRTLPFEDESVVCLYSSHMLEHLYFSEAMHFLGECRRILKRDGIVRIAIPDLESRARAYCRDLGPRHSPDKTEELVHVFLHKDRKHSRKHGHRYMYDAVSLTAYLVRAGFVHVRKRSFQEGDCPDLHAIETNPRSLFIEAVKR